MSSIKAELLKTLETAPESAMEQTLVYLKTLLKNQPTFRPGSGRSVLRHAGKWQGKDFHDCLQSVYDTRSEAQF